METYEELQEEFEKKVKKLQEKCLHPRTMWVEQWWAVGHPTGYEVLICKFCNKIVKKRKYGGGVK